MPVPPRLPLLGEGLFLDFAFFALSGDGEDDILPIAAKSSRGCLSPILKWSGDGRDDDTSALAELGALSCGEQVLVSSHCRCHC